jgi:4-hydroxy-tetrahydrodipicolinate synthase
MIVEGITAGAAGWIAGLVNAFPKESVALFETAKRGDHGTAFGVYQWFLPLLRMDTVPKFVQMIKLAQHAVGMGNPRVRPPRLELDGEERRQTLHVIQTALSRRPQ